MPDNILIIGAGGHAKVIIDIIEKINEQDASSPKYTLKGLIDSDHELYNAKIFDYPILGTDKDLPNIIFKYPNIKIIIGIGSISIRQESANLLKNIGAKVAVLEHPSFQKAKNVIIGEGTTIMANTAINTDSRIGNHCIINTGATIDHDNIIGDFCNISPGCHLGGNVTIDSRTMLGIGVNVLPGISIGSGTIIGAGSTVINNIPDNVLAVGLPAKIIKYL